MNRTDRDFAAYENLLSLLRRHPNEVRRLHPGTRQDPPRRGDSLTSVDAYFRRVSVLRASNRTYIQRLVVFANHAGRGIDAESAVQKAWREVPHPV